jgi:hypothetical protein
MERHRPPSRGVGGLVRLLGQMCRRVVAGDRVLGEDHRQRKDVEQEAEAACVTAEESGVVHPVRERRRHARVMVRHEDQDCHHGGGARDVPPHGDVVQDRKQLAGEDVHQCGEREHDHEDQEHAAEAVAVGP